MNRTISSYLLNTWIMWNKNILKTDTFIFLISKSFFKLPHWELIYKVGRKPVHVCLESTIITLRCLPHAGHSFFHFVYLVHHLIQFQCTCSFSFLYLSCNFANMSCFLHFNIKIINRFYFRSAIQEINFEEEQDSFVSWNLSIRINYGIRNVDLIIIKVNESRKSDPWRSKSFGNESRLS